MCTQIGKGPEEANNIALKEDKKGHEKEHKGAAEAALGNAKDKLKGVFPSSDSVSDAPCMHVCTPVGWAEQGRAGRHNSMCFLCRSLAAARNRRVWLVSCARAHAAIHPQGSSLQGTKTSDLKSSRAVLYRGQGPCHCCSRSQKRCQQAWGTGEGEQPVSACCYCWLHV